jgi:hypothetical protein
MSSTDEEARPTCRWRSGCPGQRWAVEEWELRQGVRSLSQRQLSGCSLTLATGELEPCFGQVLSPGHVVPTREGADFRAVLRPVAAQLASAQGRGMRGALLRELDTARLTEAGLELCWEPDVRWLIGRGLLDLGGTRDAAAQRRLLASTRPGGACACGNCDVAPCQARDGAHRRGI